MSRPADYWKSLLLLALAPLCWAGNQVVGRGVVTEISPIALNFWRWAVAVAILAVITGPVIAKSWPVIRGSWLKLLVLALSGASIFQTMIYWSLQHTTAIKVRVLN